MTTVRELMHTGLVTCASDAPLPEVAGLLREHRIHAVIVVDAQKHSVGVISDTDLLAGEWLGGTAENLAILRRMTAGELMSRPLATVGAADTAQQAAAQIRGRHVARLIVTDGTDPIGMVSIPDLLAALLHGDMGRSQVQDVMSWGYVACGPETPVHGAVRAMLERDSRSLVVIDGSGTLAGVVTGFDLLAILAGEQTGIHVAEFMKPAITIEPTATLQAALDLMLKREIHRLVVVDPARPTGPPLGLISTTDIMVEMASPNSAWQQGA